MAVQLLTAWQAGEAVWQLRGMLLQIAWHILNRYLPMEILSEIGPEDWEIPLGRCSETHMLFYLRAMQQIWMCMSGDRHVTDMPLMLSTSHTQDLLAEDRLTILNSGVHKVITPVMPQ